jgi:hypothetical protein
MAAAIGPPDDWQSVALLGRGHRARPPGFAAGWTASSKMYRHRHRCIESAWKKADLLEFQRA